ncbi:hypothetical protein CQW23_29793 [Capsicum baccatum]|uniref:AN1-type domain-containing protein n=1 Tax=Capsicum baccatum TaxID=33114 RepID=A0A2G2VCA5_CAPBA|nr:hypothetical protein CQW23_29793 [Capsicum baccatum]
MGQSLLICTGGSLMVTVQYSNDYKDANNEALHTQYIFCADVPHGGPVFHAAGTGAAVASADVASQISQVKSKKGLKKCKDCPKRVGLTGFSCKCGDLICAVHHYSDKHNCPFDYMNAGQKAIAKANPIIVAAKLNRI